MPPGVSCQACLPWARADPPPRPRHLRWLQNGRPAEELSGVQVASQGTMLHIDRVEPGHAGLFSCQATNEAGTAGAEVELSVHGEGARAARKAAVGGARGRVPQCLPQAWRTWEGHGAGLSSSPETRSERLA